jgi:hypothetical protein
LVVAGVGVNKLVFGKLLAIVLLCYFVPLGLLYLRSHRFAMMVDRFAIPVPRIYHSIAILAIVAIVETSPASKRGEINEFAISSIAFLVLINPVNRKVFLPGALSNANSHESSVQATELAIAASRPLESEGRRAA